MDELMFLVQEDGEFFKKRWYRMAEKKYACKDMDKRACYGNRCILYKG